MISIVVATRDCRRKRGIDRALVAIARRQQRRVAARVVTNLVTRFWRTLQIIRESVLLKLSPACLGRRGSLVRIQSPRPLSEFRGDTGVTRR